MRARCDPSLVIHIFALFAARAPARVNEAWRTPDDAHFNFIGREFGSWNRVWIVPPAGALQAGDPITLSVVNGEGKTGAADFPFNVIL